MSAALQMLSAVSGAGDLPVPARDPGTLHIALTGHRPQSLPGGYDRHHPFYRALYDRLFRILYDGLDHYRHITCHSGMAMGADTVWARVIVDLREAFPGAFSFIAEVPTLQQPQRWPDPYDRQLWSWLLGQADTVNIYAEHYRPDALFERNDAMIDAADLLLAVHGPAVITGGTVHAVRRVCGRGIRVFSLDPHTLSPRPGTPPSLL